MRTGAVASAAYITDNLALFDKGACAHCQTAHMTIGSFIAKVMAQADIFAIAAIPASLLHIACCARIYRRTVINSDINARMPVTAIAAERIRTTAKRRRNITAISRPLARRNITTIIFVFNSTNQLLQILSLRLGLQTDIFLLLQHDVHFRRRA